MNAHTTQILENTRDAHNRSRQLLRDIKRIETEQGITKENKALLQAFNEQLEKDFSKGKLSIAGWQKSISEAIAFCRAFDKPIAELTKKDIQAWYEAQEQRLLDSKITAWTLRKYASQARKLLRFAIKSPVKKYIDAFDWIAEELPAKPKRAFQASDLPTQAQVKELLQNIYVSGKIMSVRNRAIASLCNDSGCRVSEALEIRCKDIAPEENFLRITLPKSKTEARSIVSLLAKPALEEWGKIRQTLPKQTPEAPFFCDKLGQKTRYPVVRKSLNNALKKTGLEFPKNKAMHFFRAMFASRSYAWPTPLRNYWLGWSTKGVSDAYTALNYKACVKPYFEMLQEEKNPMLGEEKIFWEKETDQDAEFRKAMLDLLVEEIGADKIGKAIANIKKKVEQQGMKIEAMA